MSARGYLEQVQIIPRPRDEVFAFFADAMNLERITPPYLQFRILTPPPIEMRAGMIIDYRLKLLGVPFQWRTSIESVDPGRQFVDVQVRGPYKLWRHTHDFESVPEGTRMTDRVEYELRFGPLGWIARELFVRGSVRRIFEHRREAIAAHFGAEALDAA